MTGRVTGIGGLFFRATDPDGLAEWYKTHLGIENAPIWFQDSGPTLYAPFPKDSDYFPEDRAFMLNLRVEGMEDLIARLEGAGIMVERDDEWNSPEVGRFVRIHDPEGNPIELWEPILPDM